MTTEQITSLIISLSPSVLSIVTAIGVIIRVLNDFKELKKQVVDMKEVKDLNNQLDNLIAENYELKKTINNMLTKIDHVQRK